MDGKPLTLEERQALSVMVMANNMTLRNILVDTLRRLDYRKVTPAKSPEDAIKTIQVMPPDLLLVQHHLGDEDGGPTGARFAAVLRKRFKFPIIAISREKPGIEILQECTDAGINHLVALSISAESLNRAINQTLMLDMLLLPRLKYMKDRAGRM